MSAPVPFAFVPRPILPPLGDDGRPILPAPFLPAPCGECGGRGACGCRLCPGCQVVTAEADVCGECGECRDVEPQCCECWPCEGSRSYFRGCGRTIRGGDGGESPCDRCGRCPECCECEHCGGCDRMVESTCQHCNECDTCCDCRTCGECSRLLYDDSCGCGNCHRHCECEGEAFRYDPSEEGKGPAEPHHRARKGDRLTRLIGLEVEVSETPGDTYKLMGWCDRWGGRAEGDGSIPNAGCELVTPPAAGSAFRDMVGELADALKTARGAVDGSCGLHCHVDARDLNYYDLHRLIRLYCVIEPAVYLTVPRGRATGGYSYPCRDNLRQGIESPPPYLGRNGRPRREKPGRRVARGVAMAVYGLDLTMNKYGTRYYRNDQKPGCRYRGLNLHSWFYRGTVELRMHEGTVSAEDMMKWGELWAHIVGCAATWTDKRVDGFVRRFTPAADADYSDHDQKELSFSALLELCPDDDTRAHLEKRRARHSGGRVW